MRPTASELDTAGPRRDRSGGAERGWATRSGARIGAGVIVAALFIGLGCRSDPTTAPVPLPDEAVLGDELARQLADDPPALQQSEFCRRILDLDTESEFTTDDESTIEDLAAEYRELLPIVPAEIAPEFAAVLDELEMQSEASGDAPATTTISDDVSPQPPAAELSAVETLAAYLDQVCRSTTSSPLPPPTTPGQQDAPDQ